MIKKIDHLVITTAHPQELCSFYEKMGFNIKDVDGRLELFAGDFKINVHIKGHELSPHAGTVTQGSADLCFEIDSSLEEFKAELLAKHIEIELGVVERNGVMGKMKSIYLRDPENNLIEFCRYE